MVMSKIVLNFIQVIHQNEQLISTIKNILEIFPEAVIIRGYDKDKQQKSELFANIAAKLNILHQDFFLSTDSKDKPGKFEENKTFNSHCSKLSKPALKNSEEIFKIQEENQQSLNFSEENLQAEQVHSVDSKFYSIKTIKVSWME
mmetsp:Transcript_20398/g.18060  ORF Transcript_20398/g.18060 Transcript_20398/m.18060 type:complete len:145 (+) Transcript_20398:646-1080(+)